MGFSAKLLRQRQQPLKRIAWLTVTLLFLA
jgi:hypothetical protein